MSRLPPAESLAHPTRHTLHISNLHFSITNDDLLDIVRRFGTPSFCRVAQHERGSRGYGFVSFATEQEANDVMAKLSGLEIRNRRLQVAEADIVQMAGCFTGTVIYGRIYQIVRTLKNPNAKPNPPDRDRGRGRSPPDDRYDRYRAPPPPPPSDYGRYDPYYPPPSDYDMYDRYRGPPPGPQYPPYPYPYPRRDSIHSLLSEAMKLSNDAEVEELLDAVDSTRLLSSRSPDRPAPEKRDIADTLREVFSRDPAPPPVPSHQNVVFEDDPED